MHHTSRKPFGPIRDAYAFFLQHGTEVEADIRAYLPHLHPLAAGDRPLRLLDFGCGDGAFTATLLARTGWLPERLQLALVEPDEVYRHQAVARLQPYSTRPVCAWPALPRFQEARFDVVLANHVLYYVPDLDATLAALLRTLAPAGLFCTAMGGQHTTLARWCRQCFACLGRPYPFHMADDLEGALARHGIPYEKEDVHYDLVFPDTREHRLTLMRFILGQAYHEIAPPAMLALLDPYAQGGRIVLRLGHEHFMVRPSCRTVTVI